MMDGAGGVTAKASKMSLAKPWPICMRSSFSIRPTQNGLFPTTNEHEGTRIRKPRSQNVTAEKGENAARLRRGWVVLGCTLRGPQKTFVFIGVLSWLEVKAART